MSSVERRWWDSSCVAVSSLFWTVTLGHTSCPGYPVPVFSLRGAGDIRSHHKGCVAGLSGLQPGKGCVTLGVQVAFQSCFWAGSVLSWDNWALDLGQLWKMRMEVAEKSWYWKLRNELQGQGREGAGFQSKEGANFLVLSNSGGEKGRDGNLKLTRKYKEEMGTVTRKAAIVENWIWIWICSSAVQCR